MSNVPNVSIETITPEIAERYLTKNTHNRNVREVRVNAYAADMENGDWKWNGEAIKFAEDGTLLDGQHRLHAIVRSGITVQMLVIRDLPKSTQHTMDTGANRKFSDVLKLRGEEHYVGLAAAVRGVYLWNQGFRTFGGGSRSSVSNSVLLHELDRNPWLRDVVPLLTRVSHNAFLPIQVSAAIFHACSNIEPDDATDFFEKLSHGIDQNVDQPIFTLAKLLQKNRSNTTGKLSSTYLAAVTVKSWNAYRAGETVGYLRFVPGGRNPEHFPEPK
ncbi:hypothetical protein [Gordonia sp. YC-JH1]|uniref:ParB/Sulfiredoxin domain-containing protein n=2 Tax=Gordonia sihwensis TaxID=173559 RepID=L7LHM1_9ACTN|nr:hypothetical protein [Gordonia sp. YC-JH1]AUH68485.1 hypothetical protein CXX93_09160 [Gordonia sp. YC-JH1]GAC60610.1 hypothetical protein GSI01S_10_02020 [Gordonia sihwensis NBRC 108236]